ncbi:DUF5701 family protein [Cellulomonas bogoriensis]|uniref:Uncharacterized protein n=1 Tax=Cellulomonas bogoriensis 69B4 = DSM 16987 TaxID=1386082 RepID=A0A0A0BZS8_9CELL|nr:DUF5701 family protein [Cellulomonas bogoriensis]KGM13450.1 hypothetical protein N869_13765 [Cellulomonas bogoriensis 69B4 = DSM 16987]
MCTTPTHPPLPALTVQADRLIELGVRAPGLEPAALLARATTLQDVAPPGSLLAVHPRVVAPSVLAGHMTRALTVRGQRVERSGFVVADMDDVDDFTPTLDAPVPDADLYAVVDPTRGEEMTNWSPEEALPVITGAGRTPLTLSEGIQWVLHAPEALKRNRCFMTIGSRLRRPDGTFDARTPALWISNGTGRDGSDRRGAPKVGWCWWRNRHTWLGFASAAARNR